MFMERIALLGFLNSKLGRIQSNLFEFWLFEFQKPNSKFLFGRIQIIDQIRPSNLVLQIRLFFGPKKSNLIEKMAIVKLFLRHKFVQIWALEPQNSNFINKFDNRKVFLVPWNLFTLKIIKNNFKLSTILKFKKFEL